MWDHERGTWQYDVLCLLIIAFIFLSPKTLLEKPERATQNIPQTVKSESQPSR